MARTKNPETPNRVDRTEPDPGRTWQGSKYTDETRLRFLELVEKNGLNVAKTCRQMGIGSAGVTVRKWKRDFPWFAERMSELMHSLFDDIEEKVFDAARNGDACNLVAFHSRKFLLVTHPEGRRRGYTTRQEITGKDGKPLTFLSLAEAAEDDGGKQGLEGDGNLWT